MNRHTRDFYEQEGIRGYDKTAEARLKTTLDLIPNTVESVLDAGCGTGLHLAGLKGGLRKAGFDLSLTGLGKVQTQFPRFVASINAIPAKDQSFDLVLCTEVLEHLSDRDFRGAVECLVSISRQFILISVPFCEDLQRKMARCKKCGEIYHIHYHMRRFDLNSFPRLFHKFRMVRHRLSGPLDCSFPGWVTRLRQGAGRWEWDPNGMCPVCGTRGEKPQRTLISIGTGLLGTLLGKRQPKWISVLFERASK